MTTSLTAERCEREIHALHDFFVEWYCGTCEEDAFDRLDRALAPAFERVAPDGSVADKAAVLDGIRATHDDYEQFEIEIRNVEVVRMADHRALLRYDEWQTTLGGSNGRRSSVLFGPATDAGDADSSPMAEWLYLHETWLDAPDES